MLKGYFYPENTAGAATIHFYDTGLDRYDIESLMRDLYDMSAQDVIDRDAEVRAGRDSFPFVWVTHKNEELYPQSMATPHLFYALRMVFNHVVPPVFRVLGPLERDMKRYDDVKNWSTEYKTRAVEELSKELDTRDDLDRDLRRQYDDLKLNARTIVALGI